MPTQGRPTKITDDIGRDIIELRNIGMTYENIADKVLRDYHVRVCGETIRRYIKNIGVQYGKKKPPELIESCRQVFRAIRFQIDSSDMPSRYKKALNNYIKPQESTLETHIKEYYSKNPKTDLRIRRWMDNCILTLSELMCKDCRHRVSHWASNKLEEAEELDNKF